MSKSAQNLLNRSRNMACINANTVELLNSQKAVIMTLVRTTDTND